MKCPVYNIELKLQLLCSESIYTLLIVVNNNKILISTNYLVTTHAWVIWLYPLAKKTTMSAVKADMPRTNIYSSARMYCYIIIYLVIVYLRYKRSGIYIINQDLLIIQISNSLTLLIFCIRYIQLSILRILYYQSYSLSFRRNNPSLFITITFRCYISLLLI